VRVTSPANEASGRRRRLSTEDRRAEILASAIEVFSRHDVDRVSMAELAAHAHASPALIYHYFGDKAGLADIALNAVADELITHFTVVGDADPMQQLLRSLADYLDFLETHPSSWAALLRARYNPSMAAIAERVDDSAAAFMAAMVEAMGFASPHLGMALRAWLELIKGTCLRWLETGEPDRSVLEKFLGDAFSGVVAAAPH
jgi:AcrR family transcriptional regulator